ncbi:inorganic pyrophosphatase/exopolyphosphatase [Lachnospiraceae bacterium PF1-21]|uniref:putative manganese-dependent inorganic diphosphatase n=1 Tax=Ohessyouella blattaphilus TaxID=2949333 RepID=UPI003E20997F
MSKVIYVVGHKNPDTDSICSAIAYANLKNLISDNEYMPKKAGHINDETAYVLNKFKVKTPSTLANVRLQVKDIDIHDITGVSPRVSIREAWQQMKQENVKALPVLEGEELVGIISTGDIARSYMDVYENSSLADAGTQYKTIAQTLDGEVLTGNPHGKFMAGKVAIGTSDTERIAEFVEKDDLVIVGNREDAQRCAVEEDVSCMVVCGNAQVSEDVRALAEEKCIVIIRTAFDSFNAVRLINQSIPVKQFMSKGPFVSFRMNEYVDDIKEVMASKKFRDFPILDKSGRFKGFISRRRFMNSRKKKVILVDHNEKSQAIEGIGEAEILEIIDHHRLASIETMNPVYFRNQPVGCTATIVSQMYDEHGIVPDQTTAGLLCAAIISDTLLFRSPTCTPVDELTAKRLAGLAGIDMAEMAKAMFKAGSALNDKTPEEIVTLDFKQFTVDKTTFGIGQCSSMSSEELADIRQKVEPIMEKVLEKKKLSLLYLMLTNIVEETSLVICAGKGAKELLIASFELAEDAEDVILKGVVSRKKQVTPAVIEALQQ